MWKTAGEVAFLGAFCDPLRLRGGRESEVIGSVRNQLVAKGLLDLVPVYPKDAGHSLDVAGWRAHEIAGKPGHEHAKDTFRVEVLAPVGPQQAEGFIQLALGISEARHIGETVRLEEPSSLFFIGQVHERKTHAPCFDGVFL